MPNRAAVALCAVRTAHLKVWWRWTLIISSAIAIPPSLASKACWAGDASLSGDVIDYGALQADDTADKVTQLSRSRWDGARR